MSILQGASSIAIFQAVLMAVFFAQHKKSPRLGNVLLASMLLIFSVVNACSLFISFGSRGVNDAHHKLLFLLGNLAFFIGPLLFLYVKSLLVAGYRFERSELLHFAPFAAAEAASLVILAQYQHFNLWNYPGRIVFSGTILLQTLAYVIASIGLLQTCGLTVRSFMSYIDNGQFAWLRFLIGGYILLWSTQLQLFVGWDVLNRPQWCPYATSLYFLSAFLFFNGIVYIGLKRPDWFHENRKYRNSVLTPRETQERCAQLTMLMEKERLFVNANLTLADVAGRLEIAPCSVSQIINGSFHQNFRDYINTYRIEESKRLLLQEGQRLNIMGIAFDAGFNSKSAFNAAFKKHTGQTPKDFKKRPISSPASRPPLATHETRTT